MAKIVGFVEAPTLGLDLPLDLRCTAFQQRMWRALSEIPVGTTVSYADIARSIGQPKAVRAVAQACGANRLAVAIPCHRVVRSNGDLSGYRWGVERKQALLAREAAGQPQGKKRDRKSVVKGTSVSVRVDLGRRRTIKKKKNNHKQPNT